MREKNSIKPNDEPKQYLKIPTELLKHSDSLELDLEANSNGKEIILGRNSRCVSVDTFLFAPEGRKEKMEQVYNYLSGVEFRQSMEGIVEAFVTMKGDLDSEKRAMQRLWKKREKQLERALDNTAGMYGDLQGIVGRSLTAVEGLELDVELIESS